MKNMEKKIVILYILLIVYCLFGHILFVDKLFAYDVYLTPVVWLFLCCFTYFITKGEKGRYKAKVDKVQTIFIIVLLYLMIYFASGLVLGYVKSPYSHSMLGIAQNLWSFVTIAIFEEYIRNILVGYTRNRKELYVLIVLLFTLFEINFYHIGDNFITGLTAFKYISSSIFPILVKNILFTYLAVVAGTMASLAYRLPMILATLILPIFPDFNWFLKGISESLLPLIIYFCINKIHEEKTIRYRRRKQTGSGWIMTIVFVILIFFIAGFFKYKPVSVLSNSMADIFYRGDLVIVEKIDYQSQELNLQDIIEYNLDGYSILHRIIEIKVLEDGTKIYRTKGDNNNAPDYEWVRPEQIRGIVKLRIPKIGYPAVWLNELFKQGMPNVETPK